MNKLQAFQNLSVRRPFNRHNPILAINPTNPSVRMANKGHSSFGITAILYSYRVYKTLFWPIKPTNPSVRTAYKDQSSFRKPEVKRVYNFCFSLRDHLKVGSKDSATINMTHSPALVSVHNSSINQHIVRVQITMYIVTISEMQQS